MPTCKGVGTKGPCKLKCEGNYCYHHVGQASAGGGGGGAERTRRRKHFRRQTRKNI